MPPLHQVFGRYHIPPFCKECYTQMCKGDEKWQYATPTCFANHYPNSLLCHTYPFQNGVKMFRIKKILSLCFARSENQSFAELDVIFREPTRENSKSVQDSDLVDLLHTISQPSAVVVLRQARAALEPAAVKTFRQNDMSSRRVSYRYHTLARLSCFQSTLFPKL